MRTLPVCFITVPKFSYKLRGLKFPEFQSNSIYYDPEPEYEIGMKNSAGTKKRKIYMVISKTLGCNAVMLNYEVGLNFPAFIVSRYPWLNLSLDSLSFNTENRTQKSFLELDYSLFEATY